MLSVRTDKAESGRRKTTRIQSLTVKTKPKVAGDNQQTPRNFLSINENDEPLSARTPNRKIQLQDSIVCFRKFLNDEPMWFRECQSKELLEEQLQHSEVLRNSPVGDSMRNCTIIEETEEDEPQGSQLETFYLFLTCPYKNTTLKQKLKYFQIVQKLQQQYRKTDFQPTISFQPQFLCFYVNQWLNEMGYNTAENRQRVVKSILSFVGQDTISTVVQDCYDKLFGQFLPGRLHLMLLLEVCRNGWQYIIFFAVRFFNYVKSNIDQNEILKEQHWQKIESLILNKIDKYD